MTAKDMFNSPSFLSTARLLLFGWILTSITNFPAAFMNTIMNTAVEKIETYMNESYVERGRPLEYYELSLIKSGMNSGWYAGQILGAIISPAICDKYGRKIAYVVSTFGMTAGIALQAFAVTTVYPEILLLGRGITSLCAPVSDAALMLYLQEIAPTVLRGTLSSLYMTGYCVMCVIGMTLGHEDVMGSSLFYLLLVPVLSGLAGLLFTLWMPETPKYLMSKKDRAGALRSLKVFQGDLPCHEEDLDQIESENKEEDCGESGVMVILGTRRLRKAFFLACAALSLTLPFYPMLQSSTHFFTHMGVTLAASQTASSLLMAVLFCACITATAIIDRLPRRAMMLAAGSVVFVCLLLFSLASVFQLAPLAIAAVFVLVAAYGVGIGPVAFCIPPELVPTAHRSVMFCMCYAAHSAMVVATTFTALPLFDLIGTLCFIPLFALPLLFAIAVLFHYLPETCRKEISVIYAELKYGRNKVRPEAGTPPANYQEL